MKYCVDSCPLATYPNLERKCINCETGCDSCTATKCLLCSFGYYFNEGHCSKVCSNGTYIELSSRSCKSCHLEC